MNEILIAGLIGIAGMYLFFFVLSFLLFFTFQQVKVLFANKAMFKRPGIIDLQMGGPFTLDPACLFIRSNRSDCLPLH